eukprot:TRINITY_DN217_c0_g1_i5.p1 TRINITY_DN217_c0_g1~~TRINITY_DN217_c0_g1_i5.p1  ORF type:complete len:649 (-),score=139.83 TRINITY_DN217_c0_g1_i5:104-1933(-)
MQIENSDINKMMDKSVSDILNDQITTFVNYFVLYFHGLTPAEEKPECANIYLKSAKTIPQELEDLREFIPQGKTWPSDDKLTDKDFMSYVPNAETPTPIGADRLERTRLDFNVRIMSILCPHLSDQEISALWRANGNLRDINNAVSQLIRQWGTKIFLGDGCNYMARRIESLLVSHAKMVLAVMIEQFPIMSVSTTFQDDLMIAVNKHFRDLSKQFASSLNEHTLTMIGQIDLAAPQDAEAAFYFLYGFDANNTLEINPTWRENNVTRGDHPQKRPEAPVDRPNEFRENRTRYKREDKMRYVGNCTINSDDICQFPQSTVVLPHEFDKARFVFARQFTLLQWNFLTLVKNTIKMISTQLAEQNRQNFKAAIDQHLLRDEDGQLFNESYLRHSYRWEDHLDQRRAQEEDLINQIRSASSGLKLLKESFSILKIELRDQKGEVKKKPVQEERPKAPANNNRPPLDRQNSSSSWDSKPKPTKPEEQDRRKSGQFNDDWDQTSERSFNGQNQDYQRRNQDYDRQNQDYPRRNQEPDRFNQDQRRNQDYDRYDQDEWRDDRSTDGRYPDRQDDRYRNTTSNYPNGNNRTNNSRPSSSQNQPGGRMRSDSNTRRY